MQTFLPLSTPCPSPLPNPTLLARSRSFSLTHTHLQGRLYKVAMAIRGIARISHSLKRKRSDPATSDSTVGHAKAASSSKSAHQPPS